MAFLSVFNKRFHFFGDGGNKIFDFAFRAFGVEQDAPVGKVTDRSRNVVFARKLECLEPKSDALDVSFKPNVRVVNLFIHEAMQTSSRVVAKKIFSQANRGNA